MNDVKKDKDSKDSSRIDDLNNTLTGVENDLLRRALDRSRGELEHAVDFINKAAEDGIIDITCDGCSDEEGEGDEDKD